MDRKLVRALIVVFVTMIAVGMANVLYTNHVDDQRRLSEARAKAAAAETSRRSACALVTAFDDLYRESPPSTPAGQRVAALWASYREQLRC